MTDKTKAVQNMNCPRVSTLITVLILSSISTFHKHVFFLKSELQSENHNMYMSLTPLMLTLKLYLGLKNALYAVMSDV